MDIKNKTQANINKNQTLKHPHAESDSNDDSNHTLFPSFIVLESMRILQSLSCLPSSLKKTLGSLIKPKSVKKLINNTLPKKTFSDLLKQKYFHNIKIKAYPHAP